MTDHDLSALEEKAEGVPTYTRGPWRTADGVLQYLERNYDYPAETQWIDLGRNHPGRGVNQYWESAAAHIAACSPDVILALIKELRELREFRDEVARDPYFDSDPASLLKTIQTRARVLRVMETI